MTQDTPVAANGHVDESVVLHFSGSTWRFRLATYARSLARPRRFVPILVVFVFPILLDRVPALLVPSAGLSAYAVALGAAAAALVIAIGAVASVLARVRPSTISFDDGGIREQIGGRTVERGWEWVF